VKRGRKGEKRGGEKGKWKRQRKEKREAVQ